MHPALDESRLGLHSPVQLWVQGDRFIGNREVANIEVSHYNMMIIGNTAAADAAAAFTTSSIMTPKQMFANNYSTSLAKCLFGENRVSGALENENLLVLTNTKTGPIPTYSERVAQAYSNSLEYLLTPSRKKRTISTTPVCIMDAPELVNDYLISPLDWSKSGFIAVALGTEVYFWRDSPSHKSNAPNLLFGNNDDNDDIVNVCSLSWSSMHHLAAGNEVGVISIWDTERQLPVRTFNGHIGSVASLDWSNYVLSSGGYDSKIINWDTRARVPLISTWPLDTNGYVVSLKGDKSGSLVASGDTIGDISIYCTRTNNRLAKIEGHNATVKAIAWCPWQDNLLATGAGRDDPTIKFWNTTTSTLLDTLKTQGQVSALIWLSNTMELISSHGYAAPGINIWRYPMLSNVVNLRHGENTITRIGGLALSSDRNTLLSIGSDEALCFWDLQSSPAATTPSSITTTDGPTQRFVIR